MAATASDAAASSTAGPTPAQDESTPSSAAKNQGSMPNTPGPNTPGFPPVALYQPRSRPLSYAPDPGSAALPTSPTSPSALPAFPPTPGLPPDMNSKQEANGQDDKANIFGDGLAKPQQHDFSNDEHSHPTDETGWSPAHPCFPHPNPHVPLTSPLYDATRVIRIPRDWMAAGDLYPAFSTTYPEILIPWISEASFRGLVNEVNAALKAAFEPATGKAVLDGLLGLLSGWLLEDVGLVGPKKRIKEVEAIVDRWNADRTKMLGSMGNDYIDGEGEELVMVVPLRRTAYMSLDIQIPDPKIKVVGEGEGEDEGDEDQSAASERSARKESGEDADGGIGEHTEKAPDAIVGGE